MWLRNVSESDVSSSYIHRPARFCSSLCSDQTSFTYQFMEKFITKNLEIIDFYKCLLIPSVKYMKLEYFEPGFIQRSCFIRYKNSKREDEPAVRSSVTSSWELTAETRASTFLSDCHLSSGDRTLKVRRTWSWKQTPEGLCDVRLTSSSTQTEICCGCSRFLRTRRRPLRRTPTWSHSQEEEEL